MASKMPKTYVKTIGATMLFTVLVLLRLGLLASRISLPNIPASLVDFLIIALALFIIVNEKLTRSERWHFRQVIFWGFKGF